MKYSPFQPIGPYFPIVLLLSLAMACDPGPKKEAGAKEEKEPSVRGTEPDQTDRGNKVILFFGNSLTAGYQLKEEESFPSRIQEKIDSAGLDYRVINAGLSGETTAGGLRRIDWVLQQDIDAFVLELGANDVLRGIELSNTRSNLRGILQRVREKDPDIKIFVAGMLAPPNMGTDYTEEFAAIYPALAREFDANLIPFLLEGVAGDPELNLPDGMHPNPEGQRIVAGNVWEVIREELRVTNYE